ncbi:ribosome biogenesis GTP-binding protein YihA/YsxC [Nitriliruptor alkaliphilus]|uniref:ribosome biogenesis GTP-binding protein YihA/YsxC n=1 Tax=Nitriliruptor alkaliphilus TaxID=427918 RepID=UPI00069785A3|nr:ribosome biogenesis GTP-binding protein YihA/YsxC [Nitriliruptor alkaliphilus]
MSGPLSLRFVTSADRLDQLPRSRGEVAVIGRSNVGKSSLLNALAASKGLAKVSSKPGRTQLLNVFAFEDGATLVDLPGFGYASSASKTTRSAWRRRMEGYLLGRQELRLVLMLVDGAVGPAGQDTEVLEWLREHDVPFQVVATKHDKVKSSKRERRKRDLADGCDLAPDQVLWVSAERGVGLDRLRGQIRDVLAAR